MQYLSLKVIKNTKQTAQVAPRILTLETIKLLIYYSAVILPRKIIISKPLYIFVYCCWIKKQRHNLTLAGFTFLIILNTVKLSSPS